jgi:hypothetical protein
VSLISSFPRLDIHARSLLGGICGAGPRQAQRRSVVVASHQPSVRLEACQSPSRSAPLANGPASRAECLLPVPKP